MHRDRPQQVKRNVPGAIPERMGDREGECGVTLGTNVGFFLKATLDLDLRIYCKAKIPAGKYTR